MCIYIYAYAVSHDYNYIILYLYVYTQLSTPQPTRGPLTPTRGLPQGLQRLDPRHTTRDGHVERQNALLTWQQALGHGASLGTWSTVARINGLV